ncbi:hypothetical protein OA90_15605 [Labrenzia sp. OB1]|nr:hypothetical protein OA90_15605 [Labrenzia sp. OB1]
MFFSMYNAGYNVTGVLGHTLVKKIEGAGVSLFQKNAQLCRKQVIFRCSVALLADKLMVSLEA